VFRAGGDQVEPNGAVRLQRGKTITRYRRHAPGTSHADVVSIGSSSRTNKPPSG
jgi:hypothetical protein